MVNSIKWGPGPVEKLLNMKLVLEYVDNLRCFFHNSTLQLDFTTWLYKLIFGIDVTWFFVAIYTQHIFTVLLSIIRCNTSNVLGSFVHVCCLYIEDSLLFVKFEKFSLTQPIQGM